MCRGRAVTRSQGVMGTSTLCCCWSRRSSSGPPGLHPHCPYRLHWPVLRVRLCPGLWPGPIREKGAPGPLFAQSWAFPVPLLHMMAVPAHFLLSWSRPPSFPFGLGAGTLLQSLPASSLPLQAILHAAAQGHPLEARHGCVPPRLSACGFSGPLEKPTPGAGLTALPYLTSSLLPHSGSPRTLIRIVCLILQDPWEVGATVPGK